MGGEPGSRGVPTGAEALQSVLVGGHLRHRDVGDLAHLGGVERELFTVVGGQYAEVAVALRRAALQVALEVAGGDGASLAPHRVHPDQRQVRGDHLAAADAVGGTDGCEALPTCDLVLPRATGVGRGLRGGLGLRRLRVRDLAVVAVVGDEADDQERDGQGRDADVALVGAVPGHEAGQEATPPVPGPGTGHEEADADDQKGFDKAAGGGVDAHVQEVGIRQTAVGVGGGGRGGVGAGLVHVDLQGEGKNTVAKQFYLIFG